MRDVHASAGRPHAQLREHGATRVVDDEPFVESKSKSDATEPETRARRRLLQQPPQTGARQPGCTIKGSSSQMRIEQPAKLVLFMLVLWGAPKRNCQRQGRPPVMDRAVSGAVDQSSTPLPYQCETAFWIQRSTAREVVGFGEEQFLPALWF